eukprot:1640521-Prorocentrum_lima.AAC.1
MSAAGAGAVAAGREASHARELEAATSIAMSVASSPEEGEGEPVVFCLRRRFDLDLPLEGTANCMKSARVDWPGRWAVKRGPGPHGEGKVGEREGMQMGVRLTADWEASVRACEGTVG